MLDREEDVTAVAAAHAEAIDAQIRTLRLRRAVLRVIAARASHPTDPSPEQVDAWIELPGLVEDPAFRARVREMAVRGSADPPEDPGAARRSSAIVERVERYWQLLGVINGWPPVPSTMGAWRWTIAALRAPAR